MSEYNIDLENSKKLEGRMYTQANGKDTNITKNNAGNIRLILRS